MQRHEWLPFCASYLRVLFWESNMQHRSSMSRSHYVTDWCESTTVTLWAHRESLKGATSEWNLHCHEKTSCVGLLPPPYRNFLRPGQWLLRLWQTAQFERVILPAIEFLLRESRLSSAERSDHVLLVRALCAMVSEPTGSHIWFFSVRFLSIAHRIRRTTVCFLRKVRSSRAKEWGPFFLNLQLYLQMPRKWPCKEDKRYHRVSLYCFRTGAYCTGVAVYYTTLH